MADKEPPGAKPRSRTRLIVQAVVSLVLVVAIFYYLLRGIDLAQVWAEIRAMTWMEDAVLAVIAAWNLATYAFVWMSVTPGLGFWRAMVMTQSATAVTNTVPTVGPAIGVGLTYQMLGSWGYSRSRTTVAVLVSGVWNAFAKLGLPVLALALVALQGNASGGRVVAAVAGIAGLVAAVVVFALLLRSERLAERFGLWAGRVASRLRRLVGRPPVAGWELATVKFRTRTLDLLEHGWVPITAATVVSHLSLYAVLLVTLRAVGVSDDEVSWAQVLAVFAFARLATAIPFTPGGAGVVELVLIAGLTAAGGDREQVTAAVLVYRALTWALPILVGIICYLGWRRSRLRPQPVTAGDPQVSVPDPQAAGAATTDRPGGQARASRPRAYVRHPGDVLRVVLGALILLTTMTAIHQHRIGIRETNVFRLINDLALPGWTKWPVWGVMQLGVIGAVPLVALLALATKRIRLAAYAALAGGTIYLVAKLVKEFVQRGRPPDPARQRPHPVRAGSWPWVCVGALGGGGGAGHGRQPLPGPPGQAGRLGAGRLRLRGPHLRGLAPAVRRARRRRARLGRRRAGAAGVRRPHRPTLAGAGPQGPARPRVRPGRPSAADWPGPPLGPLPGLQPFSPRPVRQDRHSRAPR
jgi:uncharacterized membrane protein YbhN (UPF0104 family)